MNMKELFDDFTKYVDAMSDADVLKSITDAVAHTANSFALDCETEDGEYVKSAIQQGIPFYRSGNAFMYCSVGLSSSNMTYKMSGWEEVAA